MVSHDSLVAAPPDEVFAYLADFPRHWNLLPGVVDVVEADDTGALLRLHGPLGVRRTVRTRVTRAHPPLELAGRARTADGSVAVVRWALSPVGGQTRVRLSAEVERTSKLDRALLAMGGERWLDRALARAVARLELVAA
ncbi:MAG TPA: SRPBCC family protein [Solirubrobacteraceae bacterium]